MDKLEILKLALANSSSAREALDLAKEMADFVAGPETKRQPLEASNRARVWSNEDCLRAAEMVDAGHDWETIGRKLSRTPAGVEKAWRDGKIPSARQWEPMRKRAS